MPHPQYMLNPGDMFSVDLDKVLFATGAPKGLPRSQDPKWINRKRSDGQNADNEAVAAEKKAAAEERKAAALAKAEAAKETDAAKEAPKEGEEAVEGEAKGVKVNKKKEKEATSNWWDDPNRDKTFDPSKPYRTPWRPRYFLSAFAFIPKYLEVNHNIGHAVYLRDPVAKPGQSEVRKTPGIIRSTILMVCYRFLLLSTRRPYSLRTLGSCAGGRENVVMWVYFRLYYNTDRAFFGLGTKNLRMSFTYIEACFLFFWVSKIYPLMRLYFFFFEMYQVRVGVTRFSLIPTRRRSKIIAPPRLPVCRLCHGPSRSPSTLHTPQIWPTDSPSSKMLSTSSRHSFFQHSAMSAISMNRPPSEMKIGYPTTSTSQISLRCLKVRHFTVISSLGFLC
jgi:ribosomal protein S4